MHRSGENISMILKNTMEKLKTVSSLVLHLLQGVLYSFMQSWKMVLSFIGYQYRLLFNVVFNRKLFHIKDLMNFNFGIVFLISLLLLIMIFQTVNQENILVKIKKHMQVHIFLLLTGATKRVIQQIPIIRKFRTNISAHIYWHQKMAIMRLSQITD